jgi:Tfp pilus assembly protein PilE
LIFSLSNDSPVSVKIFVAILLIAAVPAYAQTHSRSTLKTGDAQKVAKIIRSDKAKIQTYCEINKVSDEMNQAYGKNDKKRSMNCLRKLKD